MTTGEIKFCPMAGGAVKRRTLADQIRDAIERSGRSQISLAFTTGIDKSALSRFVRKERGLSFDAAERLTAELGLSLTKIDPTGVEGLLTKAADRQLLETKFSFDDLSEFLEWKNDMPMADALAAWKRREKKKK
jgi:transcriptional regulator with XRE-family HTH domain